MHHRHLSSLGLIYIISAFWSERVGKPPTGQVPSSLVLNKHSLGAALFETLRRNMLIAQRSLRTLLRVGSRESGLGQVRALARAYMAHVGRHGQGNRARQHQRVHHKEN